MPTGMVGRYMPASQSFRVLPGFAYAISQPE